MVPAISSASLPAVTAGERLPALPAADAYARTSGQDATSAATLVVQLDPKRSNGTDNTAALGQRTAAGQSAVQDAPLPPRRRAQDAARAPGFPASPYVAQLLAQQAFPPTATTAEDGLAAYQATAARGGAGAGSTLSLHA
jgi:hypothetical protein